MKIKLKKCEWVDDWYTIVRAEHDGREWYAQAGESAYAFMTSERLSPEACIEGPGHEMLEIAEAIKRGGEVSHKRCAVYMDNGAFMFYSPRNSRHRVRIEVDEANELADQIIVELKK